MYAVIISCSAGKCLYRRYARFFQTAQSSMITNIAYQSTFKCLISPQEGTCFQLVLEVWTVINGSVHI